jgi:hypothetical protein
MGTSRTDRFEVRSAVRLSRESVRADYVMLRTIADADAHDPGRTLRRLWGLLPQDTILELRSIGRPYRSRSLDRLLALLYLHYADEPVRLEQRADLCGMLLVPTRTPSLDADARELGLEWRDLGAGCWSLTGGPFALRVAEVDVAAETEDDDLLRCFGHAGLLTAEARRWLAEQMASKETGMAMQGLEGYDEVVMKLVTSLPFEQRVAGLDPEQRLAGLSPEQRVLAMPDDAIRAQSPEYFATLSEATRTAIRARIGR